MTKMSKMKKNGKITNLITTFYVDAILHITK